MLNKILACLSQITVSSSESRWPNSRARTGLMGREVGYGVWKKERVTKSGESEKHKEGGFSCCLYVWIGLHISQCSQLSMEIVSMSIRRNMHYGFSIIFILCGKMLKHNLYQPKLHEKFGRDFEMDKANQLLGTLTRSEPIYNFVIEIWHPCNLLSEIWQSQKCMLCPMDRSWLLPNRY